MATDWVKVSNPDGKPYFWNTKTDETSWNMPIVLLDSEKHKSSSYKLASNENNRDDDNSKNNSGKSESNKSIIRPVSGPTWQKVKDDNDEVYWWNVETNETRWQLPGPPKKGEKVEANIESIETRSRRSSAAPKLTRNNDKSPIEPPTHHARSSSTVPAVDKIYSSPKSPTSKSRRPRLFGGHRHGDNGAKNGDDWSDRLKQLWKDKGGSGKQVPLQELVSELEIGNPYQVEHVAHVSFDAREVKFNGLPSEWKEAQEQFGVSLNGCPRIEVPGYDARIPAVLVFLRKSLEDLGGLKSEGLFRIAPDGTECSAVKEKLNKGMGSKAVEGCNDPHLSANLIKQFYRELKPNLLNSLSRDEIMEMSEYTEDEQFENGILKLPEPNRSAFLWLLDLMACVAEHESVNRMSPKNLAIVISPNLFNSENQPPMEALVLSQKTANLVTKFLLWQIRKKKSREEDRHTDDESTDCDNRDPPSPPLPPAPPLQQ
mmetsp:Transcript_11981/g.15601  ORF Transcript_11981/g.15601 Transcript_11981/m.15601 type:complete len:486 (+) Transcript_11981:367-1824(+)|eukprot:CAMPEP_0204830334 /NCGR_PEP_ID=MMETSP1346-20131115/8473_1 /ASSEMBLY_ACC=CAM_ASM_000771 /TAXON_ID=215587 /ORGANISM="Aplanochytrium stocchinoi, Strain GSBS06" /LENGTH=485 /DNA_ID=CAMNT_0051960511 /DNA_START=382 /DNA_END=1839 /DNA_ORIENTATION=-